MLTLFGFAILELLCYACILCSSSPLLLDLWLNQTTSTIKGTAFFSLHLHVSTFEQMGLGISACQVVKGSRCIWLLGNGFQCTYFGKCALDLLRCVAANNIWAVSFCVNAYRMLANLRALYHIRSYRMVSLKEPFLREGGELLIGAF
jgi:hypothetical protein